MAECKSILFAWDFDGNGGGKSLACDTISKELKADTLAWVHMNATHKDTRKWLKKEVSYLDDLILDALLADETRPRIIEFDEGALLILRGINLNEGEEPEDMVSIRLWIDANRIISLERRNVKAVRDIEEKLKKAKGPKNAGDFLVQLAAQLLGRIEPVLTQLDEATDDIEEKVMENPSFDERQTIVDIRKQAIILRRYMSPQRDVMQHLRTSTLPWLDAMQKRHLQESYDRVLRYVEDLDAIRERAQVVKDELTNTLSDRLNKNLYVLSVVAAIFLPLGFLTGLLGINIPGIPGVENPNAFWIFCAALTLVVSGQVWLFKKLKWF
jgi:zinc transporter